jgi:hypothetical protein
VVVDTSAVLAVLLREPSRDALTEGRSPIAAPSLPWEVGNALTAGLRRRKLTAKAVQLAWAGYVQIPVRLLHVDVPGVESGFPFATLRPSFRTADDQPNGCYPMRGPTSGRSRRRR